MGSCGQQSSDGGVGSTGCSSRGHCGVEAHRLRTLWAADAPVGMATGLHPRVGQGEGVGPVDLVSLRLACGTGAGLGREVPVFALEGDRALEGL